jgi:hypothetical protein
LSYDALTPNPTPAAKRFTVLPVRERAKDTPDNDEPIQFAPLFVERYTLPPPAAKKFDPLTRSDVTVVPAPNPEEVEVQLDPLFVDTYTPLPVTPAKRLVPIEANEYTVAFDGSPVFVDFHAPPLFDETKTPPVTIPANRLVPPAPSAMAYRVYTLVFVRPVFEAVHEAPLSVERYTPPLFSMPAKRLVPLITSVWTPFFESPVFIAVHVEPLSVDRYTPPPLIPAKRFEPLA